MILYTVLAYNFLTCLPFLCFAFICPSTSINSLCHIYLSSISQGCCLIKLSALGAYFKKLIGLPMHSKSQSWGNYSWGRKLISDFVMNLRRFALKN